MRLRAEAQPLAVAAAYVAAMAFFIYAIADRNVGYGSDAWNAVGLVALAVLHLATGWAIGRWWAVLLPALAIPLAVPAGYPERTEPELWIGIAYVLVPVGTLLIGLAVAFRRLGWPRPTRA